MVVVEQNDERYDYYAEKIANVMVDHGLLSEDEKEMTEEYIRKVGRNPVSSQ